MSTPTGRRKLESESDFPPHHLTRWKPKTLRWFLEKEGFEILACSHISPGILPWIAGHFTKKVHRGGLTGCATAGEKKASASILTKFFAFSVELPPFCPLERGTFILARLPPK